MADRFDVPEGAQPRRVDVELPDGTAVSGVLITPDLVEIDFTGERFHLYDQIVVDGRLRRLHGHRSYIEGATENAPGDAYVRLSLAPIDVDAP